MRIFASIAVMGCVLASPALAWSPPSVGTACRSTHEVTLIAGNYLGGRVQKNGVVDRKSFQACFRDIASCESWLARRAGDFPLPPGIATCVPVRVSGRR